MKRRTLLAIATFALLLSDSAGVVNASAGLASCLGEKGFLFYGASWCPYCARQKKMFGSDAKNLPYVECSADRVPHGKGTQVCDSKGIDVFPTWQTPDGLLYTGVRSREELAAASGCSLD